MNKKDKRMLDDTIGWINQAEIVAYRTNNTDLWHLANRLSWEILYCIDDKYKRPYKKGSIAKLLCYENTKKRGWIYYCRRFIK